MKNIEMSPRVKYLHEHRKDFFDRSYNVLHDRYFQKAYDEFAGEMKVIQNAMGTKYFLENKPLIFSEHDLIAGCAYRFNYNTSTPWLAYPYDYDPRVRPVFQNDDFVEARNAKAFHHLAPDSEEAKELDRYALSLHNWECKHWETGHIVAGYSKIIREGFGSVLERCNKYLSIHTGEQLEFTKAMKICCEASIRYITRYAELAEKTAETASSEENKQQMLKIAAACRNVATKPASNFFEAVQLFWLIHELLYTETFPASISMGRFDVYMNPFLEKDLADGTITEEEAQELMQALWVKFSENLHAYQNITLGGLNQDGTYTANKMTYLTMQTSYTMRYDQPLLNIRYHKSMPEALWQDSMLLVKTGMGMPAFHNDIEIFESKRRMGLAEEDLYNYAFVGCVEPTAGDGKEYSKTECLRINWAKVLEMMLTNGKCFDSEDRLPPFYPRTLESIKTYDEFYSWYKKELLRFTEVCMDSITMIDASVPYCYPTPLLSITMEGCIEKGKDVTGGGTIYNHTGINACGMANAVDSLAAIKYVVFDKQIVSLTELAEILQKNFVGYEEFQKFVTKKCPKYGNDEDSADLIMKDLLADYNELVKSKKNARGGDWQLGLYSVEDHAKMGLRTGAMPNGKLQGQSLANAMSPVQGADHIGPTALVNSVLKSDVSIAANNMVLDMKFTPTFMGSQKHVNALRMLIETYFNKGGLEIQFNVVERATLLDAQLHPEKHEDLVVRVSGFSAYFTTLMKATQDEIIARTEYEAI
jgi:pyruvate formate-lyase/glycerol dehydratase family glycyl radical enzyme